MDATANPINISALLLSVCLSTSISSHSQSHGGIPIKSIRIQFASDSESELSPSIAEL